MALSDLMVVMDGGRIMQAGLARDVFERPANAFVARFIGGHNVLETDRGLVSVRADRCRIVTGTAPHGIRATVVDVEYQGPLVRVAARTDRDVDATALVPDRLFYEDPVAPGDAVTIAWSEVDEHGLSRVGQDAADALVAV